MIDIYQKKFKEKNTQYPLNLPNDLYKKVKEYSIEHNVSMNYLIKSCILYTFEDLSSDLIKEFIQELEYNQKINFENHFENRIDIDYVIERLYCIMYGEDYGD